MVRGIEAAAEGMKSILVMNDIIANNLANVNTPGFKQSLATFKNIQEVVLSQTNTSGNGENESKPIGSLSIGSLLDSTVLDFKQGGIKNTGNPLDLAINGEGFFVVQTPNGEAYTRNGSFIRNKDGAVTTVEGYPVMGEKGPLVLGDADVQSININSHGEIEVKGEILDKVKVVNFKDSKNLESAGNSLFKPFDNQKPVAAENFEVNQRFLESSNANVVESMINSISGQRTYEALSKLISDNNKTLGKAVNEVGRVRR